MLKALFGCIYALKDVNVKERKINKCKRKIEKKNVIRHLFLHMNTQRRN